MPKDPHVYVNVHYQIEAGYVWGKGMAGGKDALFDFSFEVIRLLESVGFHSWRKSASSAFEGSAWLEKLYCHPMDVSGWVRGDRVDLIADLFRAAKTFRLRAIDRIKDALNYDPEELERALSEKKAEIVERLVETYRTMGENQYMHYRAVSSRIPFVPTSTTLCQIEGKFVAETFESLVSSGTIVKHPIHANVYRTAACGVAAAPSYGAAVPRGRCKSLRAL